MYLSAAAGAFAMAACCRTTKRLQRLDRILGDIAYPLFLCHWAVASLIGLERGWLLLAIGLPLSALTAAGIWFVAEKPFVRLRNQVRGRKIEY